MREMQELLLFIHQKKHTPRHPRRSLVPWERERVCVVLRASSQFSRMGTPQEGSLFSSLVATARGGHSAAAHNRRPRRRVHLTSQIHNSLTLCRTKRPAATALMDTDKWSLEEYRSRDLQPPPLLPRSSVSPWQSLCQLHNMRERRGRRSSVSARFINYRWQRYKAGVSLFCDRRSYTHFEIGGRNARKIILMSRQKSANASLSLRPLKFLLQEDTRV